MILTMTMMIMILTMMMLILTMMMMLMLTPPPLANLPPQITRRSSHLSLRHDFFPCGGFVPRHLLCPPAILKILTRMPRPTNLCDPRLNQIEEIEIE